MFKLANTKFKRRHPLQYKSVKQSEILVISFLISILHNTPRILEFNGIINYSKQSLINAPTWPDVLFKVGFIFVFSYVALQYNANLNRFLVRENKLLNWFVPFVVNGLFLFGFFYGYLFTYPLFTGVEIRDPDKRLLTFVLLIILFGLMLLARNLRYRVIRRFDKEEKEKLKQQNLQNELAALKNQINPHFLFNSLNSLNSMIRENKEATTFVNKLSHMYRYILQSGQQDLVVLKEELKFIDSYIFLIKARYRDRFSISIEIEESYYSYQIPVLTLQLLIENAVKHNEISADKPLNVRVYVENERLIVENKIQPRTTFVDSTGQGLINIEKRYQLLKGKSIHISNENDIFRVQLPLN